MKNLLRKICSPILNVFEQGDEPYAYKSLNRKILLVMAFLFSMLALSIVIFAPKDNGLGYLFPTVVFAVVSFVCLTVGALGTDRAVAKIWGSRS